MKTLRILLLVLFFCGMGVGTAHPGQADHRFSRSGRNALLVINRAPDFGFRQGCVIYIDGVSYGILGYNRRLESLVTPGAHVVTMVPAPNFHRAVLGNHQRIYVDAGRPNFFTLSWFGGDVPVLK
jgi:hypothetical protein